MERLGASVGRLAAWLRGVASSWAPLGSFWGILMASWALLGASWSFSNPIWRFFGGTPIVENRWKTQGKTRFSRMFVFFPFMCVKIHFCAILDRFGMYLEHQGALLRRTGVS